jgi:hypothetical protein
MKYITSKKPVTTKVDGKELSVSIEVPQWESIDEFVSSMDSADDALAFLNSARETGARNVARVALGASGAAAAQSAARGYVPGGSGTRNYVQREKAAKTDEIASLMAQNLDPVEFAAKVQAILAAAK